MWKRAFSYSIESRVFKVKSMKRILRKHRLLALSRQASVFLTMFQDKLELIDPLKHSSLSAVLPDS